MKVKNYTKENKQDFPCYMNPALTWNQIVKAEGIYKPEYKDKDFYFSIRNVTIKSNLNDIRLVVLSNDYNTTVVLKYDKNIKTLEPASNDYWKFENIHFIRCHNEELMFEVKELEN